MTLLMMMAAIVGSILYIPASPNRRWHALGLIVLLATLLLTHDADDMILVSVPFPEKLIQTLLVWTAAISVVQFTRRAPAEKAADRPSPPAV